MLHPQVEIFLQVAESGSFNKAALIKSCSSVSIMNQINSLENRLGIKLLVRTSHGISLTEAGNVFYKEAQNIRRISDEAIQKVKTVSVTNLPVIRIGTSVMRPCKPFLDYLAKIDKAWAHKFRIKIVPFGDSREEFSRLQQDLGRDIDCFVSPCDSASWASKLNIFYLGECRCCITLSMNHRHARKKMLKWKDLHGEKLMVVAKGISPVLDQLRTEILQEHPEIMLYDSPNYYDIDVFNHCAQGEYLMETPETWSELHPALVTLPVNWKYKLPFGVVYSKNPSSSFEKFIFSIINTQLGER